MIARFMFFYKPGVTCRYHSACLRDAASNPARGLGAATTWHVSATPPATLLGGWAPLPLAMSPRLRPRPCSGAGRRYHSTCLRDSAGNPARGLDTVTSELGGSGQANGPEMTRQHNIPGAQATRGFRKLRLLCRPLKCFFETLV